MRSASWAFLSFRAVICRYLPAWDGVLITSFVFRSRYFLNRSLESGIALNDVSPLNPITSSEIFPCSVFFSSYVVLCHVDSSPDVAGQGVEAVSVN